MKTILALCLFTAFGGAAQARLGETANECTRRYGEPVEVNHEKMTLRFHKAGLAVLAVFRDGLCVMIGYAKLERDALDQPVEMSEVEREALRTANAGDSTWKRKTVISIDEHWETEDGKRLCLWQPLKRSLVFTTVAEAERLARETAEKEKQKLDGF